MDRIGSFVAIKTLNRFRFTLSGLIQNEVQIEAHLQAKREMIR